MSRSRSHAFGGALAAVAGAALLLGGCQSTGERMIAPGEDILADLVVSRLNITLSEDGTILGMGCY